MKVVIIGGVAGGASAAARLRRLDESAEIIMLERSGYVSYANCGLPYYVGGAITDKSNLTLQTPESFAARFNVDARVHSEAIAIDPEAKLVTVKNGLDGSTYTESYDELILSPGAKAIRPNLPGIDLENIYTIRTVEDTFKVREYVVNSKPKSAVVVGGGFIGVEMAENLKEMGINVSLVELQNQVMAPFDYDMACNIHNLLRKKGINLQLGTGVTGFNKVGEQLEVCLSDDTTDIVDMVVLAIGVTPDTALAQSAGIALGQRGAILTDECLRTNIPNIYAAGDAIEITNSITGKKGLISLAGPANKEGRIIADNICGIHHEFKGAMGSSVLKVFDFTAASTGLNERTAKDNGFAVETVVTIAPAHASYYPNAVPLVMKTIFEQSTGRVLGAQAFGQEGVDKRINVIATAIAGKMTCSDLAELDLAYAPPYSSAKDQTIVSGFIMENILAGRLKQFYWHEVDGLRGREDVTLLDVRTPAEREEIPCPGSINIPVDSLRSNLHQLDKSKKIYVTCLSGLRSYVACCMLANNGFDVYSLSGGMKLYSIIMEGKVEKEPILACGVAANPAATFVDNCSLTADEIKSVKGLGFLHCKGTNNFNGRVITRNGKVTGEEMQTITTAAKKYGNGEVAMTTRLTMEVQGIPFENIEAFRQDLLDEAGLLTGGTGSKVRPVVSCKGTTCQYGLMDTYALSDKIHQRFYVNYHGVSLPHKFKIAVGGCPNNCVKPNLNDLGIVGQEILTIDYDKCRGCGKCGVIDFCPIKSASLVDGKIDFGAECNHCGRCQSKCHFGAISGGTYGYKVYLGGRWGKKFAHGQPLSKIFTSEEEVLDIVDKAILLFRTEGISGERFADTVTRLGMEKVEEILLSNDLLARREEILGLDVEGGASC